MTHRPLMNTLITRCTLAFMTLVTVNASAVERPSWTVAPYVFERAAGDRPTATYRPWFENGSWSGDLIEYSVAIHGAVSTDVPVGSQPPASGVLNWSARAVMAAREAADASFWQTTTGRKIIAHDGSNQVPFRWSGLSDAQKILLDPATADPDGDSTTAPPIGGDWDSDVLNFVRGDRSQEGSGFRLRSSIIGAFRHSAPIWVGPALGGVPRTGYPAYVTAHANRAPRIYVGGNGGLLHAFDAETGAEAWAFAPSRLFSRLKLLTPNRYVPTPFVDGDLAVGDVLVSGQWRTVIAGGYGGGAPGLYALDVTSPTLSGEISTASDDQKVLWETPVDDPRIGHVYGSAQPTLLPDGKSYVVAGNGTGSVNGSAELLLVDIATGVVSSISTGASGDNGLATPTLLDNDGDGLADRAYAGDFLGNLWRFDLDALTAQRVFEAETGQAFTTAPEVTTHPLGGTFVYIASGQLFDWDDAKDTRVQAVYAIRDDAHSGSAYSTSNLSQASLWDEGDWRLASGDSVDWTTQVGWYVDLSLPGERVLTSPVLRDKRLQFTSVSPDSGNWFVQLDWLNGGSSARPIFDVDADGDLDSDDRISDFGGAVVPAGRLLGEGDHSEPTFARIAGGHDVVLINGLAQPTVVTCSGACEGGLAGGHVDVDTDTVLGSSTDAHTHEYDDNYNVTFINFTDLEPPSGGGLGHIDAMGIDPLKPLVAILANADLSPGGSLSIGSREWSVVDYQEMVQQRLASWDGVSPLTDATGQPLSFTLGSIGDALSINFDDQAIANGGLHPTKTSCVKSELLITNGRWRNGALTLQVLDAAALEAGASLSNGWVAQMPGDLAPGMLGGGLHANLANPSAFLYESTMFWHHSGSCYGEADYEESVIASQTEVLAEQLVDLFPIFDKKGSEVLTLISALKEYTCEAGVYTDCASEADYRAIENQLNEYLGDYQLLIDHLDGNSGTYTDGTPSDVVDSSTVLNPASGPNYALGRRNWIDLRR